jgi:hypothetical protein
MEWDGRFLLATSVYGLIRSGRFCRRLLALLTSLTIETILLFSEQAFDFSHELHQFFRILLYRSLGAQFLPSFEILAFHWGLLWMRRFRKTI